jgi:hypothetical protein
MWRWAAVLAFTCAAACGGRLLPDDPRVSGCSAAGAGGARSEGDGASQAGRRTDGGVDASSGGFHFSLDGGVPWDALPLPEAGPVPDCLACARDNCGEVIDGCARSQACLVAAACAALRCPASESALCPSQCSERDPAATLASAMILACLLKQCPEACQPLSSLGGFSAPDRTPLGGSGAGGLED